jgi:hypothetical protein
MKNKTCESCLFFDDVCRRYPPQESCDEYGSYTSWPGVIPSKDWCGEYVDKDKRVTIICCSCGMSFYKTVSFPFCSACYKDHQEEKKRRQKKEERAEAPPPNGEVYEDSVS